MSSTATVVPEMAWGWPVKHKDNHIDVKELENMRHEVDDSGDDFLDAIIKLYPACDSCAASHFSVVIESELNKYKRGTQTGLVDGSTRQAQPALPLADQKKVVQILANAGTFKAEQVAFLERLIDLKNATMSKLFIAYERDRDANALIQGLNALPEGHATDYSTEFKTITSQQKNQTSQAQAATKPVLTAEEHVSCFMKQVTEDPPWLDRKLLREGQLFFLRYSTSASIGMLYFSLLGGFSAPKIIKVLDETGYLTKQDRDVTWRRLNETLEMVVDCAASDDALEVGERGWLSVLKVRMLHSRVRRRIENNYYSEEDWDEETFGKPINQEDMMGTLLSFSANILETIDRVGGAYWMTEHQKFAFLHFWRYIGFLIGVSDNYNPLTSVERANGAVESIVLHLLHPSERSGLVARHVISAVSNRPPLTFWGHDMHAEIARGLLGEGKSKSKIEGSISLYCWHLV